MNIYNSEIRTIQFSIALLTVIGIAQPCFAASGFSDVFSSHPNAEAITYVQAKGIVSGYPDGTYRPNQPINRAEFVKIIVGAYPKPDELQYFFNLCTEKTFSDVDPNAWYGRHVCVAALGDYPMITGYPDGTFKPDRTINFAEAAKILSRSFDLTKETSKEVWYRPSIEVMYTAKAIPPNIRALDQLVTRGDMAEMIARLHAHDESKEIISENIITSWLGMRVYKDDKSPLAFLYQPEWGSVIKNTNPYRKQFAQAYVFSALENDREVNDIEINFLAYDDNQKRYLEECQDPCVEGSENKRVDLLEQRSDTEKLSNREIAGIRGVISNGYSAEGGNVYRRYTFFTNDYRVEIVVTYDVAPLYLNNTQGQSLTELVTRDLNGNFFSPIAGLLHVHPEATEMRKFFDDIDAFVLSMEVHQESSIDAEAQARNATRQKDVLRLSNAIHQFTIDHFTPDYPNAYPGGLSARKQSSFPICKQGKTCDGISFDELVGSYIHDIPADPLSTGDTTGYTTTVNENGSLTIQSTRAEGGVIISVTGR